MRYLSIFLTLLCATAQAQRPCSDAKISEITEPSRPHARSVLVDCSCTIPKGKVITKKLLFEGDTSSNVTIDGAGATIDGGGERILEIKSRMYYSTRLKQWRWERPENITVRNFKVIGSARVWGMSETGEGYESVVNGVNLMKESSKRSGHSERVQDAAPTNIIFDHLSITSNDRTPLYISPGVTRFQLLNSIINGTSSSVAIYLDTESAYNTFRNNTIETKSTNRELVAIDASAHNIFMNNRFSSLNRGGIYLYRNCGQNGVARHSTPTDNWIVNNVFYYDVYSGFEPAIFLGARSGRKPYCGDDIASPYGSGRSNLDYARFNIIMQNQIYKRKRDEMIRTALRASETWPPHPDWIEANSPNYIAYNFTVDEAVERKAGCYIGAGGFQTDFILDGRSAELLQVIGNRKEIYKCSCSDGILTRTLTNISVTTVPFDFTNAGSNDRKERTVSCPSGLRIIGAKAGCNLEFGVVTENDLAAVSPNVIRVFKTSDNVSEGSCWINVNETKKENITLINIDGLTSVRVGCREHDNNGGECNIKGLLYCR